MGVCSNNRRRPTSFCKRNQICKEGVIAVITDISVIFIIPFVNNLYSHYCFNKKTHHIIHYDDVIMDAIASQITSLTIVYSAVYSGADQRKHQSSASLAFLRGNDRGPVNSPHKWPVKRKMFPFDDVIMLLSNSPHVLIKKQCSPSDCWVWTTTDFYHFFSDIQNVRFGFA